MKTISLEINKEYEFLFAGMTLKGTYIGENHLNDGSKVYVFKDEKYKYPIRKEKICGNFKQ